MTTFHEPFNEDVQAFLVLRLEWDHRRNTAFLAFGCALANSFFYVSRNGLPSLHNFLLVYIHCSGDPKKVCSSRILHWVTLFNSSSNISLLSNTYCRFLAINVGILSLLQNKILAPSKQLNSSSPLPLMSGLLHSIWCALEQHPDIIMLLDTSVSCASSAAMVLYSHHTACTINRHKPVPACYLILVTEKN